MRPFFLLWIGQALSLLGSQAVQFALIWWLTIETGSAAVLATAAMIGLLPQVLLGPLMGTLVDRWNRKRVMLISDSVVALASLALAWAYAQGYAGVPLVFTLLLVRALAGGFHGPAMLASMTLMVPKEHLVRIQGLNQAVQGGLLIVSAPLGALLWSLLPMSGVMLVDVSTALIAIIPLIFIRVPQPDAKAKPAVDSALRSLWRDFSEGLRFVRTRRGHLTLLLMATTINAFLVPAFSLLPLLATTGGADAGELGWMTSSLGVGTLFGGLGLGVWGGFGRRIVTTLVGMIGLGLSTILLGLVPMTFLIGAMAAIFGAGVMAALINGPIQALLQATVPPGLQGRVFTLFGSLAGLAAPLGLAAAAPVADLFGVRSWYLLGGSICLAIGVAGFFIRALSTLDSENYSESEAC